MSSLETYPTPPPLRRRAYAALIGGLAACTFACTPRQSHEANTPDVIEVQAEAIPQSGPNLDSPAIAFEPGVRLNNAVQLESVPADPEMIKARALSTSVRILGCTANLVINDGNEFIGIVTSAHCFKDGIDGTVAGSGVPVTMGLASNPQYVNTVTDLILNYPGDVAFGAFPNSSAEAVADRYYDQITYNPELLVKELQGNIYMAAYPAAGANRNQVMLELMPLHIANHFIYYAKEIGGARSMRVFTAVDKKHDGISCPQGASGALGHGSIDGKIVEIGPLISSNVLDGQDIFTDPNGNSINVDQSLIDSYDGVLEMGDVLCSFTIKVDRTNDRRAIFVG